MTLVSPLLSQALVAFTVEVDNLFEARMPHRTTLGPARDGSGPWLVSLAMWSTFHAVPPARRPASSRADPVPPDPAALLSRVLLELTSEYEAEARPPLAVAANALRALGDGPLRPLRPGIAREAAAQSLTMLRRHDLVR